jgi:uncharacterized protein YgiM (DUF1202 family)
VRLAILILVLLAACSPSPAPVAAPSTPAPPAGPSGGGLVTRTLYVSASALNVRAERSTESAVLAQLRKDAEVPILAEDDGWYQVRLPDGREGWVAARFVSETKAAEAPAAAARTSGKKRGGCESDYAFTQTPALSFSEGDAHGLVVVEATVSAKGVVTATKVITNNTGDPAAGAVAEREIRSAKFAPPIRNCQPRSFIFTYRRTF